MVRQCSAIFTNKVLVCRETSCTHQTQERCQMIRGFALVYRRQLTVLPLVNFHSAKDSSAKDSSPSSSALDESNQILNHTFQRLLLLDTLIPPHQPILENSTRPPIQLI